MTLLLAHNILTPFIFLGSLSLPVLAVMVTYIRLLVIDKNLCQ